MPNLRYRFTGDEDHLPVPPPPPLQIGDDSDDWWAGVHLSAVAVPLAGALAALALSASLAWGLQQQTEDIVPQPEAALEETEWLPPVPPPPAPTAWRPPDDEIPAGALRGQPDEDLWQVYTPPYPGVRFLHLPDPEEVPAGSLYGQPDEDLWAVWTPPYSRLAFLYLPDPEELPAAEFRGALEEDGWRPWVCAPYRGPMLPAWVDDEFAIAPGPGTIVEDEPWPLYLASRCPTGPVILNTPSDEAIPEAAPIIIPAGSGLEFVVPGGRRDFASAGGRRDFAVPGGRQSFGRP